ncbi:unnamed protein product [Rotaria magnacalcarata]|uniref:NHL repeat containing protein n=1 Tax=Rotaria magnacalcarata TaxID=392030 RepID=A0A816Z3X3_9BILA|nr:unnamed protein product [Rotaria magnacalcarata]CAF3931536.1 unnamed protein product [Rotaria magnacalcarata]
MLFFSLYSATTTTTAFDSCTNLKWNLTGVGVAGAAGGGGNTASLLHDPLFIYIDANDTLYICDNGNNRVQKWVAGASTGTTAAGDSGGSNGKTAILLDKPTGITFDSMGYMYITDYNNNRVQRFPPNSNSATSGTTVAGSAAGNSGSTNGLLHQPVDVKVDGDYNIFITDMGNKRVVKWAANATIGSVLIDGSSGGAAQNQISNPYGLILINDSLNHVYLSDNNQRSAYLWAFGAANATTQYIIANSLQMDHPSQIIQDQYGNLYVADANQKRVVMFCVNSTVGNVIVGTGTTSTPTLANPTGIAFDSDLNLYVSDGNLNEVLKYTLL